MPPGLFDGTPLERQVTCAACGQPMAACGCPRNAAGEVTRPGDQHPRVCRERRAGGKMVTVVSGLDSVATDLAAMLTQLKSRFGAGGTVREEQIELQGNHRDAIVAWLCEAGYRAKASGG